MTQTMISERDAVKRERKAAEYGFTCAVLRMCERFGFLRSRAETETDAAAFAKDRYPLPKMERPRVVMANGAAYRVFNGFLEVRDVCISPAPAWRRVNGLPYLTDGLTAISGLIANPVELVDEETP